jgi:hypothetical protein
MDGRHFAHGYAPSGSPWTWTLEKGFEARHEHGGFGPAVAAPFQKADVHHVWGKTICLSGALLGYNALSVIRQHLAEGPLLRLFLSPLPAASGAKHPETPATTSH